ncbi:MAG: bifunctional 2-polyprenyl-6-hydroxyphenol methylase/3-demethylubiquinol 3-O-methyltransferase UbiG [Rickettsiaceae bacterium]|nr:bifunctional 2-polyprenyl-6-hydroxyphenol methylase/3-demethylubiquinol 3-O-methyltransferase UbiG [Rickettsiaceae bacterium]
MDNISSIDEEELKKFSKTNQEWWDLNGEFRTLHEINPVRIDYIKSIILKHFELPNTSIKPLKNIKLLDIGSGGGLVCKPMYEFGADVTGIDANEHNTKAAMAYARERNLDIKYINNTVENYILKNNEKYDVILCLEVIEHVANPKEFVQNISKLLKHDGILIFSTINRTFKSFTQAIIIAEYILDWVPKNTHKYSKFIKPSELVSMLKSTPLNLSELKGLKLSLPNRIWELSDDIDINYFAIFKNSAL